MWWVEEERHFSTSKTEKTTLSNEGKSLLTEVDSEIRIKLDIIFQTITLPTELVFQRA